MTLGIVRVVGFMRPGIGFVGFGVSVQVEYLYDALPDRVALVLLMDRDAL
jgi:hypothetical protein